MTYKSELKINNIITYRINHIQRFKTKYKENNFKFTNIKLMQINF